MRAVVGGIREAQGRVLLLNPNISTPLILGHKPVKNSSYHSDKFAVFVRRSGNLRIRIGIVGEVKVHPEQTSYHLQASPMNSTWIMDIFGPIAH